MRALGTKTFGLEDQRWFAAASLDGNPMHMDPVAARRLISGRPVVHGIHTLLMALELRLAAGPLPVGGLQCQFGNPVNVGDEADFAESDDGAVVASVGDLVCTQLTIERDPAAPAPAAAATAGERRIDALDAPLAEPPAEQVGRAYRLGLHGADMLAGRFPLGAEALGPHGLAAIASLSRFVGMVCPGLHSVFSSLRLVRGDPGADELRYVVQKYDPRYRLFIVTFDGGIRGELRAFLRPPPQPQPSMQEAIANVAPGEFDGRRALVIGGSRGLGETVAKLVGAGGADVVISHAAGAEDARRVADEINAAGRGRCGTLKLELGRDRLDASAIDPATLGAIYYFATPRIFRKKTAVFDRALFDEFIAFYVDRFGELCAWLEAAGPARRVNVFLPSTAFIADRPRGMTEYAMAKAAAEVLAEELNRTLKHVHVVCTRLPRLATDQTASIMQIATGSTLEALLPIVRRMQATE